MYSISFVGAYRFSASEPYLYTCFVGTVWTGGQTRCQVSVYTGQHKLRKKTNLHPYVYGIII